MAPGLTGCLLKIKNESGARIANGMTDRTHEVRGSGRDPVHAKPHATKSVPEICVGVVLPGSRFPPCVLRACERSPTPCPTDEIEQQARCDMIGFPINTATRALRQGDAVTLYSSISESR